MHEDAVDESYASAAAGGRLYDQRSLCVFGDTTRIRILYVLFGRELYVCDIAKLLGMTQSAVSRNCAS